MELGLVEHFGASDSNGCTEQERATALLNPPAVVTFTLAADDVPGITVPGASGETETEKSGVPVMETVALADFVGSATLVAVTVAVVPEVTFGAVYRPALETVPAVADHVTEVLALLVTVAENCCVPPDTTVVEVGEMETATTAPVPLNS